MKTKLTALALVLLAGLELGAQTPGLPGPTQQRRLPRLAGTNSLTQPRFPTPAPAAAATASPSAAQREEIIPAGSINWTSADINQVLEIYSQYVGRTLLRPATLPAGTVVLQIKTDLTKSEVIQAMQAVLALNGIAVINVGEKFVKVVPVAEANSAGAPFDESSATNLPNLGSYITHIKQLRYVKPSVMIPLIQPFGKLQGGLTAIDDNGIIVMRDYAENIKRMLEMIERIDVSVPAEFISEVIPIRYADAGDIASALNSLGGAGGSTVSFGSSQSSGSINGLRGGSTGAGVGGMSSGGLGGGYGGAGGAGSTIGRPMGSTTSATTPSGTPSGGSSFQQRLQSIINRASGPGGGGGGGGQDQIQLFGQTKIIADQRSNSLLVFATRSDMERIKEVIGKLDVLLAQVLIESIIMDVGIGKTRETGVSVSQSPEQFNNSNVSGGGYMYNGTPFSALLQTLVDSNGVSSTVKAASFGTNLTGGFRYFGSIGDTWDIAVRAAETADNASIIQRPRIQTSQAKPAQFFVGETVPYVTSTYNNAYSGGYGGSSYSQLSVGVELDVTPFINPDGLVVMEIVQQIDEISGYTKIDGNDVPNTIKRTLNTEIAVKNRDTVILGGFVRANKSRSQSGVPVLMDIPVLGWLFRSNTDKKGRTELLVMMRPTVLKTPELAAAQTIKEAQRLPGVSAAAAENAEEERRMIDAQRKKELKKAKKGGSSDGFFNMKTSLDETNAAADVDFGSSGHTGAPATQDDLDNQEKARVALEQEMNAPENPAPEEPAPAQPH